MLSKTLFAFVVLTACIAVVQCDRAMLVEGPGTWFQCHTLAVLRIRVYDGDCKGVAHADCAAVAKSINAVQSDFKIFGSYDTACNPVTVKAFSVAVGKAVAAVWSSAGAKIRCDGVGWGCGWAFSDAHSWAAAFAKAIAIAITEAWSPKGDSFCAADIQAVSTVFAEAAASAKLKTCAKGGQGTVKQFEAAYAVSVSEAIAKAVAIATSKACSKAGKNSGGAAASSKCAGAASSEGNNKSGGDSTPGGEQSTGGGKIIPCVGAARCCAKDHRSNFCTSCPNCGDGGGYWTKQREVGPGGTRIWNMRNGKMCNCPKDAHHG